MRTILTFLSILFFPINMNAQDYFFCDEYVVGERYEHNSFLLDYETLKDKNNIIMFQISDLSTTFLEKIKNDEQLFNEFKESLENNTFNLQANEISEHWYEEIDVYILKILKKTPIQWFGVTYVRNSYHRESSYKNANEFKINLINGRAQIELKKKEYNLNCKIIESNIFGNKIEGFRKHYFKD